MGRFQGGSQSALLVSGLALAFAGAALFGIVAHTRTPFFERAGTAPPDSFRQMGPTNVARIVAPIPASLGPPPKPLRLPPIVMPVADAQPAGTPIAAAAPPQLADSVPPDSLSQRESVLEAPKLALARLSEREPFEANFPEPMPAAIQPVPDAKPEPRIEEVKRPEPKGPDIRTAELKVMVAKPAPARPAPVEPKPMEASRVAPKAAEAKAVVVKQVQPKVPEASRARPKPVEAKVVMARAAEPRTIEARGVKPRLVEAKVLDVKRIEPKPVALRVASVRPALPVRIEAKRPAVDARKLAEMKAVETKAAEVKAAQMKAAEMKAAEEKAAEARLAERRRATEMLAAEAKLIETKRAAVLLAAETKQAETRRAAEMAAAETRLAETKRAAEMVAAEAKLVEAQRAIETKAAEAKLAETKRAIEMAAARASASMTHAVETRTQSSGARDCHSCGTVASVVTRYLDRGENTWEVRVNFAGGGSRTFMFPTHPGFANGQQVRYEAGRLRRM